MVNMAALQKVREMAGWSDALQVYSQFIFIFGEYLQETTQSYHATLNKNKSLIWICQDSKENPKNSLLASKIGLMELKAG